jgi:uncharacterized protein (TIGR04255 family)
MLFTKVLNGRPDTSTMRASLPERHYPKAPITEAVIDVRVELPSDVSLETLGGVQDEAERVAYPASEVVRLNEFQFGPGLNATMVREIGLRFRSADGKLIHQARIDGFTVSRLAPYENWESFRAESRRLWNIYRTTVRPVRVTRIAVRYLNRIEIPLPLTDFGEYLRTVPQVSSDLPQGLAGYFMQLRLPLEDAKATAVINEAIIEDDVMAQKRDDVLPILLDIDIFRTVEIPSEDDALWDVMDQLRRAKNQTFEASITDKTRELFE